MGFQELLSELAAEHERISEFNRTFLVRLRTLAPDGEVAAFDAMHARQHSKTSNRHDTSARGTMVPKGLIKGPQQMVASKENTSSRGSFCLANGSPFAFEAPNHASNSPTMLPFESEKRMSKASTKETHQPTKSDEQPPDGWHSDERHSMFNPFSQDSQSLRGSQKSCNVEKVNTASTEGRISALARRKEVLGSAGVTFAPSSNCAINPEHSRFLERWDQITMVSLVFVAIVCPVQIAMLQSKFDALFISNCVIDCIFFSDMIIQFFVMYPKRTAYGTALEHRPGAIARNYLKSWFAIDMLSIVPFDLISILSNRKKMSQMKVVKAIRLLRLIKLMRILRASRLFRRFEHHMPISYKEWALLRFFIMLLVIAHWMANLWALTLVLVDDNVPRWVDGFEELEMNVASKTKDTPWKLYVASLYFTSYTLTSVGYGDIGPKNILERVVCTFMLVISGIAWAVVLGQVCGIVANMNVDEDTFRTSMDELNEMIRDRAFPQLLAQRLRNFFHSNKQAQRSIRHQANLFCMSPGLRGEVAIQINKLWISKVNLLRNLEQEMEMEASLHGRHICSFIIDICTGLELEVHAQSEVFGTPQVLYILSRGLVSRPPRLHLQGGVWGTDFILSDKPLLEPVESFALTYIELTVLSREFFFETLSKYSDVCPYLLKSVRRFCCWLALQRAVMKIAKHQKRLAVQDKLVSSDKAVDCSM